MIKILKLRQPDVRPVQESGDLYQLYADYQFEFMDKGEMHVCRIPLGFKYDGASVPKLAWTLIGFLPDGIHRPAALVHDWLYVHKGIVTKVSGNEFKYSRKWADQFFLKCLKHVGVKSWHARLAYWAVRGLGWTYWRK